MSVTAKALPPLEPLAAWAGRLVPGAVAFAVWQGGEAQESGTSSMPWLEYHPTVAAFMAEGYERHWILTDFDWSDWAAQKPAQRLAADPSVITGAAAADLFRLLTVILRSERFCDGAVLEALEGGTIDAIARRAAVLAGA